MERRKREDVANRQWKQHCYSFTIRWEMRRIILLFLPVITISLLCSIILLPRCTKFNGDGNDKIKFPWRKMIPLISINRTTRSCLSLWSDWQSERNRRRTTTHTQHNLGDWLLIFSAFQKFFFSIWENEQRRASTRIRSLHQGVGLCNILKISTNCWDQSANEITILRNLPTRTRYYLQTHSGVNPEGLCTPYDL